MLTHGSLFSGIGGFELGAQRAEIPTKWSCEIEKFQRQILNKHFPRTKQYEDIRELQNPEYVDIVSGGFPCQDISIAGKGVGITGKRSGLWTEMCRVIWNVRPKYVIIENSPMLLVRGFEQVLCDLFEIGYDAQWKCLSNSDFGFPHKRERLYCLAYPNGFGRDEKGFQTSVFNKEIQKTSGREFSRAISGAVRDKDNSEILRDDDGIPCVMDRIKSCGNAVNPIVTEYLFECIKAFDEECKTLFP